MTMMLGKRAAPPADLAERPRARHEMAYEPAEPGSGWVQKLPILQAVEDIPHYSEVLTREDGAIHTRVEDRRVLCLLKTGQRVATLVWTNRAEDHTAMTAAMAKARRKGFSVTTRYQADRDIIGVLYGRVATSEINRSLQLKASTMEQLADRIITNAAIMNASDIHIEVDDQPQVRVRVHGELTRLMYLENKDQAERLCNALFTMADSDSKGTNFQPNAYQDARITRHLTLREGEPAKGYTLRFASQPVHPGGWDVTLRVLPMDQDGYRELGSLGYDSEQNWVIDRMLATPRGLVVLSGATGSGKSTTLQSMLGMLNDRWAGRKKVRTIEDPPEFVIPGARQTPIVRRKGDDDVFTKAIISAMRSDPDAIMIGEVRDSATGHLVQQATQTGHKVLTTVHASSPFDVVSRLIDLGVERSVLAGETFLSGIIHQALVPTLCQACAVGLDEVKRDLSSEQLRRIEVMADDVQALRFRSAEGCDACFHQKIAGRTVVASYFVPDRQARQYILENNTVALYAYWRAGKIELAGTSSGRTLLDQGIAKMNKGLLSPLDVEEQCGTLDDIEPVQRARDWYHQAIKEGKA